MLCCCKVTAERHWTIESSTQLARHGSGRQLIVDIALFLSVRNTEHIEGRCNDRCNQAPE